MFKIIAVVLVLAGCSIKVTSYQLETASKVCANKEGVATMNMYSELNSRFEVVCKNGDRSWIKYE